MGRKSLLFIPLLVLFLGGCTITMHQWTPGGGDGEEIEGLRRLTAYYIQAPLVNGRPIGYEAELQASGRLIFDWRTNIDCYGNPVGLSDDRVMTLHDVFIELPERAPTMETIFWPTVFGNPAPQNVVHVFLGLIPEMDEWGRPKPPIHVPGYSTHCNGGTFAHMAGQIGTVTAVARIDVLQIEITCPEQPTDGKYVLDIPGATPQESRVLVWAFAQAGTFDVVWEEDPPGDRVEVFTFEIPEDWFWARGTWTIAVGPSGTCGPLGCLEGVHQVE